LSLDIPAPPARTRSPLPSPRPIAALLLAACLAPACSSPAADREVGRPAGPAARTAEPAAAARDDAALVAGLAQLDELLLLRRDPELSEETAAGLQSARESLAAACPARDGDARCRAALATLDALVGWQALSSGWTGVGDPGLASLQDSLLGSLQSVDGALPQTDAVRVAILLESGRAAEAAEAIVAAWTAVPPRSLDYAPLHAELRDGRDELPDPLRLLPPLQTAAARQAATAPASRGYLLLAAGHQRQASGDTAGATPLFEQGAAEFATAGADPLASEWELATRRAECRIAAGSIHYDAALAARAQGGVPAAQAELRAAEDDYADALEAVRDDAEAVRGLELTADAYLGAGEGRDADQPGIRDVFGRLARRFDRAEWWNNYAFFCRETGQYEQSYAAYSRCIELAPENARWVNDTGLILLYHLDRDLDHAQELFQRAVRLGQEACDNPFASDDSRRENFLAYTDAMLNLAQLHAQRGQIDQARTMIDALLALSPERGDAQALKAKIEQAQHKETPP